MNECQNAVENCVFSQQGISKISEAAVCTCSEMHRRTPAPGSLFNLQPATVLKRRRRHIYFPADFAKFSIFKKHFLRTGFGRMTLLKMANRYFYSKQNKKTFIERLH